jgi:hypothetical protein
MTDELTASVAPALAAVREHQAREDALRDAFERRLETFHESFASSDLTASVDNDGDVAFELSHAEITKVQRIVLDHIKEMDEERARFVAALEEM